MELLSKGMNVIWVLVAILLIILSSETKPSMGASINTSVQTPSHLYISMKSPTMRHLTWWRWGRGDQEKPKTTMTPLTTKRVSIDVLFPITTEKPSTGRWKSWLSKAKDKLSKVAQKVKTELKEAKESYNRGMSFVGNAAKDGFQEAGRAISTGAKTLGNATLSAGRAIKEGANKLGSAVKRGFQKIRLRFSGPDEKFKIVANRLKEKLEAGDEKAKALMEKLGINVSYSGEKISGSQVTNINVSVTEVLRNEGLLSNKSASYHTAVEQPEMISSLNTSGSELGKSELEGTLTYIVDNEDFHSAEDYLGSENDTVSSKSARTTSILTLELSETSSNNDLLINVLTEAVMLHNQTTESPTTDKTPVTYTNHIIKDFTKYTDFTDADPTIPSALLGITTHTYSSKQTSVAKSNTSYLSTYSTPLSTRISHIPDTADTTISDVVSRSIIIVEVTDETPPPTSTLQTEPNTIITNNIGEDMFSTSTNRPHNANTTLITYPKINSLRSSTLTNDNGSMPSFSLETTSVPDFTDISGMSSKITTIPSASIRVTESSTTSTIPKTKITETSAYTTTSLSIAVETTITSTTVSETTSTTTFTPTASTTTLPTLGTFSSSILPSPTVTLETVATTVKDSRIPVEEEASVIKPVIYEDGHTIVEAEPYEPPPFPDVFSDVAVHDRLREFYDQGDFSHAEMTALFNFDPDNYEYYEY